MSASPHVNFNAESVTNLRKATGYVAEDVYGDTPLSRRGSLLKSLHDDEVFTLAKRGAPAHRKISIRFLSCASADLFDRLLIVAPQLSCKVGCGLMMWATTKAFQKGIADSR